MNLLCLRNVVLVLTVGLTALGIAADPAVGQVKKEPKPKFEDVTLTTKDGVKLRCTWYPPQEEDKGKTTVPIIMLHGWEENRGNLHLLALYLQSLKHAVIVPDLRGHGRSTKRVVGTEELDVDLKNRVEIAKMVEDVEATKRFLMERNNAGEVNIEMLCVIGSDLGALVALNWAVIDWNYPSLPSLKQGQDVKALVLLSPQQSFMGLRTTAAVAHPVVRKVLSLMIITGAESKSYSDAKRLQRSFEKYHTDPQEQDLITYYPNTDLEGTKLLGPRDLNVAAYIVTFINERLVKRADRFPWRDRTPPLGN